MARAKTDMFWVHKVRGIVHVERRRTAKSIEISFASIGPRLSPPRDDWPRERTIRSIAGEFRGSPPEEREVYGQFHWPEAMTAELLPWEASAAGLELLRERKKDRPSIRLVKWFYRVKLAIPDAPFGARRLVAGLLAATEGSGVVGPDPARAIEGLLVYAPWESTEALKEYKKALQAGEAGKLGAFPLVADDLEAVAREALASLPSGLEGFGLIGSYFVLERNDDGSVTIKDSDDDITFVDLITFTGAPPAASGETEQQEQEGEDR